MPNLRDVAQAAGVSTVTASSVLSGANRVRVSPETAKRIMEVARSMNYVPRAAARGLRTGRVEVIGFITSPRIHWQPHWQEILRGVSDLLWNREERLILSLPKSEEQEEKMLRQLSFGHQVDGLVIQNTVRNDPRLQLLHEAKVPFVVVDGEETPDTHIVAFDMERFATLLTVSILRQTSAFALVTGRAQTQANRDFVTGCTRMAGESRKPFVHWEGAYLPEADWFRSACAKAEGAPLGLLLTRQMLPELLALLADSNLQLGKDLAVWYLAGVEEMVLPPPGLTVINLDYYTLGREAGKRLFKLIDEKESPPPPERQLVLPGTAQSFMGELR